MQTVARVFDDGAVTALRGIDLSVSAAEFVAIVGPSGSGKSSLVHIMAGFDRPSSGRVLWRGRELRDQRAWTDLRRREIGVVFQEFLLLPTLSALENVEIAMSGTGLPAAEQRRRAADLLDRVGLSARLSHMPHALSGGERQRVAIARSIANRPDLLLCDEPTGNLDSATADEILAVLTELAHQRGLTLIMVTHDAESAARADRVVRLKDGHLVDGKGRDS